MNEIQVQQDKIIQTYQHQIPQLFRNTIKIRDYKNDSPGWPKLRTMLNACALMVGAEQPVDELYSVIKQVMINEFKDFSPEEVLMAFYKKVGGKLDVQADHYGRLSGEYIGKVLNAYKAYRHKQLSEEIKNAPKEEAVVDPSMEVKIQARREWLQNCFIKPYYDLKKGINKFDRTNGAMFFKRLYQHKLINVSQEEIAKYRQLAVQRLESISRSGDLRDAQKFKRELESMKQGMETDLNKKIKDEACYLYFIDWAREQIQKGTDIENYLETNNFYVI